MEGTFEGFKDKDQRDDFIEFIKNHTLEELNNKTVTLEVLEYSLISYQKDELFETCEGIKKAIKEWSGT